MNSRIAGIGNEGRELLVCWIRILGVFFSLAWSVGSFRCDGFIMEVDGRIGRIMDRMRKRRN